MSALIRSIKTIATMLTMSLLASCSSHPPLATVAHVDLQRYAGDWYEVARLPNRFQASCVGDVMARYVLRGDEVSVLNRCREASGEVISANGTAKVVPESGNARLRVSFFWPFYGDYYVLALDKDYRWALVGAPDRSYLWLLSRTPELPEPVFAELAQQAKNLGFAIDELQKTSQLTALP